MAGNIISEELIKSVFTTVVCCSEHITLTSALIGASLVSQGAFWYIEATCPHCGKHYYTGFPVSVRYDVGSYLRALFKSFTAQCDDKSRTKRRPPTGGKEVKRRLKMGENDFKRLTR